jgi:hypothetical protein
MVVRRIWAFKGEFIVFEGADYLVYGFVGNLSIQLQI